MGIPEPLASPGRDPEQRRGCDGRLGTARIEDVTYAACLPLVFHDQQARVDRDPNALAARLAQHYSLLDFGPRPGHERSFMHRSVSAAVGDLVLTCGYTSPIQGTIGERPDIASINICRSGSTHYELDGRSLSVTEQQPLFFSPGHQYRYRVDHFNGLAFHVDLTRLQVTAAAMAGLGSSRRRFARELQEARVIARDTAQQGQLLGLLLRQFSLLDHAGPQAQQQLRQLGIDDLLYRTLALILCPGLRTSEADGSARLPSQREHQFEELLEWIQAHLNAPINLTMLEQRSGYSRRSLQLAFRQRFGCGPIQWLRRRRLDQARLALLDPQPGDTVSAIASSLGYRSLTVFSREFSARYGMPPSTLLRTGKRQGD